MSVSTLVENITITASSFNSQRNPNWRNPLGLHYTTYMTTDNSGKCPEIYTENFPPVKQWWANLNSQIPTFISNLLEKRFESWGQISNFILSKSKIFSEQISNQIPNLCWNTDYRKLEIQKNNSDSTLIRVKANKQNFIKYH